MKIKKSVEKAYTEDINLFDADEYIKITTTLEDLVEIIKDRFNAEEIAYFMFMLTGDSDLEIEQKYLKMFYDFYSTEFTKEEGYEEVAEGYKKLIDIYKK